MNKIKEKILLYKIRVKDEKAFAKIYDLYVEKIYRFIFFKVSNAQEAEDLTSEVFLKAWQYIKEGKKIKTINAFLYTIARNKIIDHYRKNSRTNLLDLDNNEVKEVIGKSFDLAKKIDNEIGLNNITKFLDQLKAEYKEAILLKYVDDYSTDEIAEILSKNKGNVRVLLHRALEALKEIMGEAEKMHPETPDLKEN